MLDGILELLLCGADLGLDLLVCYDGERRRARRAPTVRARRHRQVGRTATRLAAALIGLALGACSVFIVPPPLVSAWLEVPALLTAPWLAGAGVFLYGRWRVRYAVPPGLCTFWSGFGLGTGIFVVRMAALAL